MLFQQEQKGDSWEFECQHGPDECHGNMQQACMFNYVTEQDTYIDIIYCIENSGDITNDDNVKKVSVRTDAQSLHIFNPKNELYRSR